MPGTTFPQNYPYPLYTDPADGAPQIQALAEAIDDSIVTAQTQLVAAAARKRCRVSGFAAQAIPSGVQTTLTYTTEDTDTDNMVNLGVNNTIATVNTAGHYLVIGEVEFVSNATGTRNLFINWSGGSPLIGKKVRATNGSETRLVVARVFNATVGQTFRLDVIQDSGVALNTSVRRMSAVRVSG